MVKVLVVDHSPMVRQVLCASLARDLELEIVGSAPDPFAARDLIVQCEPEILTLEIDMPRMDGITFLRRLMVYHPMPALVVTSAIPGGGLARAALAAGAINVVHKPKNLAALKRLSAQLGELIKTAAQVDLAAWHSNREGTKGRIVPGRPNDPMIAIGSSTGGSSALEYLLSHMPPDSPGIVVAQQMPDELLWELAVRLNQISSIEVKIAKEGDPVCSGVALLSPGNAHMVVRQSEDHNFVSLRSGPLVGRQRPSIDLLFLSVAAASGARGTGVVLAGMGRDGTQGLLEIQKAGGQTLAQREAVALGAPKAAIEAGVVDRIIAVEHMPEVLASAGANADIPRRLMD